MRPPQQPNAPRPNDKGPQILTDRIRCTEVRLVGGDDEEQFGIVSREEAIKLAEEKGLDLIVMSLDSSPPVVKMMDFGKFKFEREKRTREAKKKQHIIEVKEIKMGVRIDQHDYQVKIDKSSKFLEQGHKLKVTIRLRGREVQHANLAFDLANKFIVALEDLGAPEANPRMEGKQIVFLMAPGKKKP